jgi:hypothetical protein
MAPFGGGVELSEGGMVVVVPGAVASGAGAAVVSAGGELAEPAGEVDSCLEQADRSASEPTHNNRTLRFIRSPHYFNGTVTVGPHRRAPSGSEGRKRRSAAKAAPRRARPERSYFFALFAAAFFFLEGSFGRDLPKEPW